MFDISIFGISGIGGETGSCLTSSHRFMNFISSDWDWLMRKYKNNLVARELPKFPEVRRDLSLVVDKTITFDQLQQIARRTEKKLLQQVNVFDVYEGDNLGAGKKSYSVSFLLQDPTQTLTDQAIDGVMQRLIQQFEQQAGALIRK